MAKRKCWYIDFYTISKDGKRLVFYAGQCDRFGTKQEAIDFAIGTFVCESVAPCGAKFKKKGCKPHMIFAEDGTECAIIHESGENVEMSIDLDHLNELELAS